MNVRIGKVLSVIAIALALSACAKDRFAPSTELSKSTDIEYVGQDDEDGVFGNPSEEDADSLQSLALSSTVSSTWSNAFEESNLFASGLWSAKQSAEGGQLSVGSSPLATGRALKVFTPAMTGSAVPKADYEKQFTGVKEGETIRVIFDMYIENGADLTFMTFADLESLSVSQNPGPRIVAKNGYLALERQKFAALPTMIGSKKIPLAQKVRIEALLKLGRGSNGQTTLKMNGTTVLSFSGQNIGAFTVDRVQLGITANASKTKAATAYFDNVQIAINPTSAAPAAEPTCPNINSNGCGTRGQAMYEGICDNGAYPGWEVANGGWRQCSTSSPAPTPAPMPAPAPVISTGYAWSNGFEEANLIGSNLWSARQTTEGGQLSIVSGPFGTGKALKCVVPAMKGSAVPKADYERHIASVREGETVKLAFNMFIESGADLTFVTFADFESLSVTQNPGPRLVAKNGYLALERQKFASLPTMLGSTKIPIGRSVLVEVEMKLGRSSNGQTTLKMDGKTVLSFSGQNVGNFTVDRIQVGISANASTSKAITAYFDNVKIDPK